MGAIGHKVVKMRAWKGEEDKREVRDKREERNFFHRKEKLCHSL